MDANIASNTLLVFLVGITMYSYLGADVIETFNKPKFQPESVETTQARRVFNELGFADKKSKRYTSANNSFLEPDRPLVVSEIP